jgi:hypothetical protein
MHLYTQDGKPLYEVPYADPKKGMRKATLRDARKCGAVPSVTEINKVLASPGLERWKTNEAVLAALTLPRDPDDTDEDFIKKVMLDSKEKATIAADKGTEIHGAIERAFQGRMIDSQYFELAHHVKSEVLKRYGADHHWRVEQSFAHPLGYGGKVDLNSPCIPVVADFKTKEVMPDRVGYDEQLMQLSAYRRGLGFQEDTLLVNIFVSWAGEVVFLEWTKDDAARGLEMFDLCLALWKHVKKYDPSFEEAA